MKFHIVILGFDANALTTELSGLLFLMIIILFGSKLQNLNNSYARDAVTAANGLIGRIQSFCIINLYIIQNLAAQVCLRKVRMKERKKERKNARKKV